MTTETRPPAITEEQLQRIISAMQRHGASVNVSDPRINALQTWIIGLVGVGLIAAGTWVGQSINSLSGAVASAIVRLDQQDKTQGDHEARIRHLERK